MSAAVFFSHFRANPHYNMAFDEWLMARALSLPASTFLRLYSWYPGAITFGYNQRQESAIVWDRVGETPVIRRVTGGRALYHDPNELTYSIVVNMRDHPSARLVGSISAVSAGLAEALSEFLRGIGVEAAYERQSAAENAQPAFFHKAPCFASAAKYELMSAGRKVIASAQKRLGDVLLQHGSIKVHGLAEHPALDPDVDMVGDPGVVLSEERFKQLASRFRLVMSQAIGVEMGEAGVEEGLSQDLRERMELIFQEPLARREIVAQSYGASSL